MSAEHEHTLVSDLRRLGTGMLVDASPVTVTEILGRAQRAVMGEPLLPSRRAAARSGHRAGTARPGVLLGSVAAATLLAAGLVVVNQRDGGTDTSAVVAPAPSTAPVTTTPPPTTVAQPVERSQSLADLGWPPRLLLDESWEVVTADERSLNEGYITFRRDDTTAYVGWYRGDAGPQNGLAGSTAVGTATLLGEPVTVYGAPLAYSSADIQELIEGDLLEPDGVLSDFAPHPSVAPGSTALPGGDLVGGPLLDGALADAVADGLIEGIPSSGPSASLRWDGSTISVSVMPSNNTDSYDTDGFVAVVESVGHVDGASWEAALPDRVVTPATRQQVVDEMLAGVPLPPGFDAAGLGESELVRDRANLAGDVQHLVACSWLDRYFTADGEGDAAAAALEAIAAMPDWPASQEVADAVEHPVDGVIPSGNSMGPLTVNDDGTITYDATGEPLDGYFAAQLCDLNAVG
jgi:hypothetical protein